MNHSSNILESIFYIPCSRY